MKAFLLIDIGTGSARVGLGSTSGEILSIERISTTTLLDRDRSMRARWEGFYEELLGAIRKVVSSNADVEILGMSVDSARQSFMGFDASGHVVELFLNTDNAPEEVVESLSKRIGIDVFEIAGKPMTEDFLAPKLVALREREPERFAALSWVSGLSEGLGGILCGTKAMEYSHATESLLYDLHENTWSRTLCEQFDIDDRLLPPLVSAGTSLGLVNRAFLESIGLQKAFPFLVGGADTQVATEALRMETGDLAIIAGTTSPIFYRRDAFEANRSTGFWMDVALRAEGVYVEANPGIAGLNYQRWKEQWMQTATYEELEAYYEVVGIPKMIAILPSQVVRNHRPPARGALFLDSPIDPTSQPMDLGMAIVADHAIAICDQIDRLIERFGEPRRIFIGGGSFRSRMFTRWMSALLDKELIQYKNADELTFLGLLQICLHTVGEQLDMETQSIEASIADCQGVQAYRQRRYQLHQLLSEV